MNASKDFRDVIVFLPGIMGSVLERRGKTVWDTRIASMFMALLRRARDLAELALTGDSQTLHELGDDVVATRTIPDVHLIPGLWKIDGYAKILDTLQERLPLRAGENFFSFPYDWRRDNRCTARKLEQKAMRCLHAWRRSSGFHDAKLVLIAHSMGGLVSRYFLEVLGGWQHTRTLITIGTPHRGAVGSLTSLANGFRFNLGPLKVELSDFCRSCTSIYQLLPIWECYDPGDGVLRRVGEVTGIPNIDPTRAAEALAFHREIQSAVETNRRDPKWGEHGYQLMPVVGYAQKTEVSATLEGDLVRAHHTIRGKVMDGDGTVPRISATPLELSREKREVFAGTKHAGLQNADAVLDHIVGVLRGADVDLAEFFAADVSLGLELADLHLASAEIRLTITATGDPGPLKIEITDVASGQPVRTLTVEDALAEPGGQARVARPLAARCSTIGGGRSDFGDLVTGGERPSGCTGGRDARVREAVRLRAASDPRVRRGGAGASAPRGVPGALRGAGRAAAGVREGGARRLRGLRGLRARLRADLLPQLRRRAAGSLFMQVARLLSLVHGPADGRGRGVAGGPRAAGGGLSAVGALVPGPDGGAFGLRRAAAGRHRRAAGAGGDAGRAAPREAAAPGVGRGLARGRVHGRAAHGELRIA
jgi:hypothetical protein